MKYKLKHLCITLLALGLSAPAFAEGSRGGFSIGIDALYLRPMSDNMSYAYTGVNNLTTNIAITNRINTEEEEAVKPSTHWAWRGEIGYWFPCTCYDFTLDYMQYNHSDSTAISVGPLFTGTGFTVSGPFIALLPLSQLMRETLNPYFQSAASQVSFDIKDGDLDFGHHFVGDCYDLRVFAGAKYAKLDRDIQTIGFPGIGNAAIVPGVQDVDSKFNGFGPHFGVQGRYAFYQGFGLNADVSVAYLVGQMKSSFLGAVSNLLSNTATVDNNAYTVNHQEDRNVPVLSGRVGIDYTFRFDCSGQSAWILEAGYQTAHYLGAAQVQSVSFNDFLSQGAPIIFNNEITTPGGSASIALDGIYVGLKYYA